MKAFRPAGYLALGLTVKSGWASVVLLAGPPQAPRLVDARHIALSDPRIPGSRQPYHAGFGTARGAGRELRRLVRSAERFGTRSVSGLIREYKADGHRIRGAGIVVGSLIDPETIGNSHIRIHALEGRLFREVVLGALRRSRIRSAIWRERDLASLAVKTLKRRHASLRMTLTAIGQGVQGGWRAEEKAAALAAWLILARRQT